jgi:hypothetical protein
VPPRRGVGGGGASSFSPQEFGAAQSSGATQTPEASASLNANAQQLPKTNGLAANVEAQARVDASPAQANASPAPSKVTPAQAAADSGASRTNDNGAARAAASANLKLVPPSAQGYGGAPSFARDAASLAGEAPFPLVDGEGAGFFDSPLTNDAAVAPRAGEDRVGRPVSLVPPKSSEESSARARVEDDSRDTASSYDDASAYENADGVANRIRSGLESRNKPLLAAALEGARRVVVDGDEVRVEFAPESKHLHDSLRKPESQKILREVCCEVLGRAVGVAVTDKAKGGGDEGPAPEDEARKAQRLMRERAEGHPAVQQLIKTFRAEIVEVRPTDGPAQQ